MQENTPRYSIIIPVYNSINTLSRCLESVLAQHRDDVEAILVDDGSSDGSRELCEKYAAERSGFRFFPRAHEGVSGARNFGLSAARGERVLFLDSDDFLDASCISELDRLLRGRDYDLVQFSANLLIGGTTVRRVFRRFDCDTAEAFFDRYAELVCRRRISAPWGKVYRLSLIRKHAITFPQGISLGEDKVFNHRYAMHCRSFAVLDAPLYWTCLDNAESLSRSLRADVAQQMAEEAKLSLDAVLCGAVPAAQREKLLRALAFDRLRNVYTLGKYYHRFGMSAGERYRALSRLCGKIRAEKAAYPRSAYCTLCVLPVKWKLLPVIDAMTWKMAFHSLVNINDKKK